MTASTPGSSLTGRGDRGIVLRAGVATFEERRETKDMMGDLGEDKAVVAVGLNKNKSQRERSSKQCQRWRSPRMNTNIQ